MKHFLQLRKLNRGGDNLKTPLITKNMEIAKYILSIFKSSIAIVLSWGFHNPVAINECEEGEGGIIFNVDGFKFSGQVKVMLNWTDTFDIYLIKRGDVVETIKDVYLDQLINVIDNRVEYTPDYAKQVQHAYCFSHAHARKY